MIFDFRYLVIAVAPFTLAGCEQNDSQCDLRYADSLTGIGFIFSEKSVSFSDGPDCRIAVVFKPDLRPAVAAADEQSQSNAEFTPIELDVRGKLSSLKDDDLSERIFYVDEIVMLRTDISKQRIQLKAREHFGDPMYREMGY